MKLVYCTRKGKVYCVTTEQFMDWFTDNHSAFIMTKQQFKESCKK